MPGPLEGQARARDEWVVLRIVVMPLSPVLYEVGENSGGTLSVCGPYKLRNTA